MRTIRSAFALIALFAAGCAVDAADPDLAVDAPNLSENWGVGSFAVNARWDSGLNANLSAWQYIHCNLDYGFGYMLTDINVYQEALADPSEFIARMAGVCREFDLPAPALPRTGALMSKTIFTAGFRAGALSAQVPVNNYPTGLQLRVDSGNTRVKDVRINYAPKNATWTALDLASSSSTSWAIGYAGTTVNLSCPAQQVMTGLDLRYDTVTGQIRVLEIHCRELTWP
ncbi:hypothetical protein WMF37_28450 [Sorangium sp. So ce291]|uniref:hypothetical protein n=1 Tax=Sorangium sp. So ce291 TaxID=3133294 RepID=UPI003F5F02CA